jgi:hypothetical protein
MAGSIFRSHGLSTASPPRLSCPLDPVYPHLPASICSIARMVGGQRPQLAFGRFGLAGSYPPSVIRVVAERCRYIGLSA